MTYNGDIPPVTGIVQETKGTRWSGSFLACICQSSFLFSLPSQDCFYQLLGELLQSPHCIPCITALPSLLPTAAKAILQQQKSQQVHKFKVMLLWGGQEREGKKERENPFMLQHCLWHKVKISQHGVQCHSKSDSLPKPQPRGISAVYRTHPHAQSPLLFIMPFLLP